MRTVTQQAPAKVNLTLDILGKRPDGYHDLRMVMQTISLYDTVTVTETAGEEITVTTDRGDLPTGPDNIAWKAADVFFRRTGTPRRGLAIHLEKHIPAQAGMAGGSADGAAVLRLLRQLYAPQLPATELEAMALLVGSDVPFCVRGGTVLAEGRGEIMTDLPPVPECFLAVCKPPFGLSTPALFSRVRTAELTVRPNHPAMEGALERGDLAAVAREMENVFEQVLTAEEAREIGQIRAVMLEKGALNAVMTGSGPTVFGIFDREDAALAAADALRRKYEQVYVAAPENRK